MSINECAVRPSRLAPIRFTWKGIARMFDRRHSIWALVLILVMGVDHECAANPRAVEMVFRSFSGSAAAGIEGAVATSAIAASRSGTASAGLMGVGVFDARHERTPQAFDPVLGATAQIDRTWPNGQEKLLSTRLQQAIEANQEKSLAALFRAYCASEWQGTFALSDYVGKRVVIKQKGLTTVDREDLKQNVMEKIWRNCHRIGTIKHFGKYLSGMISNARIDYLEKENTSPTSRIHLHNEQDSDMTNVTDRESSGFGDATFSKAYLREVLHRLQIWLTRKQQEVVELHLMGHSAQHIADELGVTRDSVRERLRAAQKKILASL